MNDEDAVALARASQGGDPANDALYSAEVTPQLLATGRTYGLPDVVLGAMTTPGRYLLGLQSGHILLFSTARLFRHTAVYVRLVLVNDLDLHWSPPLTLSNNGGVVDVKISEIAWAWRQEVDLPA